MKLTHEQLEAHLANTPANPIAEAYKKDEQFRTVVRNKQDSSAIKILGVPVKLNGIWCGECSSIPAEQFNYRDVYMFRTSNGIRVKCVQCLAEWYGRHNISG